MWNASGPARLAHAPELKTITTQAGEERSVLNMTAYVDDGFGENKKSHKVRLTWWGKPAEMVAERAIQGQAMHIYRASFRGINIWTPDDGDPQGVPEYTVHEFDLGRLPKGATGSVLTEENSEAPKDDLPF